MTEGHLTNTGGGIANSGTLTVINSLVSANRAPTAALADLGGGIYNSGNLTVTGSTFSGNSAGLVFTGIGFPLSASGGGIYNAGGLTVTDSTFSENSAVADLTSGDASGSGSALANAGTLILTRATLVNNSAQIHSTNGTANGGGGALLNSGTATINDSTLSGNSVTVQVTTGQAGGGGGALLNSGMATVTASMLSGNSVTVRVTNGQVSGGGGAVLNDDTLTIIASTLSNNSAPGTPGGGIFNSGTLTLNNSTLSSNVTGGDGGGIWNVGATMTVADSTFSINSAYEAGAIDNKAGTLTLADSTLSGNNSVYPRRGGIASDTGTVTMVRNNILAGNAGGDVTGVLTSEDHNLIGVGNGGSGYVAADFVGNMAQALDPRLGLLADNGGPTQTMALLPGSPAIDAGDPAQLGSADQRGVVRSGGVNIGAFQASATAFLVSAPAKVRFGVPFDLTVTAVDPFGQVALGYTGTVTFSTSDSDPGVVLPADYPFTLADRGRHTFTDTGLGETTLVTHGHQTITATDTADGSVTGGATVKVKRTRHADRSGGSIALGQVVGAADRFFASLGAGDFGPLAAWLVPAAGVAESRGPAARH